MTGTNKSRVARREGSFDGEGVEEREEGCFCGDGVERLMGTGEES